jgi:hypothetical protein
VLVAPGATLNLNYTPGTLDTIVALYVDGAYQLTGTWGAIGSGAQHETSQITGSGRLFVTPFILPLPGDFNKDGKVDNGDYLTWRKNNGTNNALPNDNSLGTPIGLAHLDLWRQRFGNSPGSGLSGNGLSSGNIPEPTAGLLVLLAMFGLPIIRTRQRTAM